MRRQRRQPATQTNTEIENGGEAPTRHLRRRLRFARTSESLQEILQDLRDVLVGFVRYPQLHQEPKQKLLVTVAER